MCQVMYVFLIFMFSFDISFHLFFRRSLGSNVKPTSGLDFKASADREEQYLFDILLHILTTHPRTIPNVIGMHVQGT